MKLSKELLRELFDYRDGVLYWKRSPRNGIPTGAAAGYKAKNGYTQICVRRVSYYAHRLIFLWHHGVMPVEVDHIKGSSDRVENLRAATHRQNLFNVGLRSHNTSGYKGVFLDKRRGVWYARVGKQHIGYFDTAKDADKAARAAREKIHGEFARHV